jgi:hypothetical protein
VRQPPARAGEGQQLPWQRGAASPQRQDAAAQQEAGAQPASQLSEQAVHQLADRLAGVLRPPSQNPPQPQPPAGAAGRPPARPPPLSPPAWRPPQPHTSSSHHRGARPDTLVSPISAASPSGISREDSTTEVVSVQPSEGSTMLSPERSLSSLQYNDEAPSAPATPPTGLPVGAEEEEPRAVEAVPAAAAAAAAAAVIGQGGVMTQVVGGADATAGQRGPSSQRDGGRGPTPTQQSGQPTLQPTPQPPPQQQPPQTRQVYEPLPLTEPVARRPSAAAADLGPTPLGEPSLPSPDRPRHPQQPQPRASGVPLFVPVVVCMDEEDHALVAEEAMQCQQLGRSTGGGGGGCDADGAGGASGGPPLREALRRARVVQEYLTSFEAQGLPVVRLQYGAEGVDRIHEYILQCIQVAMAL